MDLKPSGGRAWAWTRAVFQAEASSTLGSLMIRQPGSERATGWKERVLEAEQTALVSDPRRWDQKESCVVVPYVAKGASAKYARDFRYPYMST